MLGEAVCSLFEDLQVGMVVEGVVVGEIIDQMARSGGIDGVEAPPRPIPPPAPVTIATLPSSRPMTIPNHFPG
jgi:hypothetical protein